MAQITGGTQKTCGYISDRRRLRQVTKQHRYQMSPTTQAFRVFIGLVLQGQLIENITRY